MSLYPWLLAFFPQNSQTRYCCVKSSYKVQTMAYKLAFARKKYIYIYFFFLLLPAIFWHHYAHITVWRNCDFYYELVYMILSFFLLCKGSINCSIKKKGNVTTVRTISGYLIHTASHTIFITCGVNCILVCSRQRASIPLKNSHFLAEY